MKRTFPSLCTHFFAQLSSLFFSGLLVLLPIALTYWIFAFSFRLLKGWIEPLQRILPEFLLKIPLSDMVLTLLFILFLGFLLQFIILRSFYGFIEKLVTRIPLISTVYSGIRQLVHAFNPQDSLSFKKVVLVQFPRNGLWSIGFITSEVTESLSPDSTKPYFTVFVPTTPNPTTGFFMLLPETDFIVVDLTRQEAMSLIISGGIIQPERLVKK
jgi:uncharacterized membrane protein